MLLAIMINSADEIVKVKPGPNSSSNGVEQEDRIQADSSDAVGPPKDTGEFSVQHVRIHVHKNDLASSLSDSVTVIASQFA